MGGSAGSPTVYRGFLGEVPGPVAFPGVLSIVPGTDWSNFVSAARQSVSYTLMNVFLTKERPERTVCGEVVPAETLLQEGTPNIRLWWPLMYEPEGTKWTLSILYATPTRFDDDGVNGPNPPTYIHLEQWTRVLGNSLTDLPSMLDLFHRLPFGTSGVPLVSDEPQYLSLNDTLADVKQSLADGDLPGLQSHLDDFKQAISASCKAVAPSVPNPTGPGTGIASTQENPACCTLQAAAQMINTREADSVAGATVQSPDGTAVVLTQPLIATLVTGGWFYAQDQNRTCGLKVIGDIEGLQPGGAILLRGIMGSEGSERVMSLVGSELQASSGPMPRSLGMPNSRIRAPGRGCIPGFVGGSGIYNGGLRVTVFGRVRSVEAGYCYIDDGAHCADGTGSIGLRLVLMPGVIAPALDAYVAATGISSWFEDDGVPEPALVVASQSELVTVAAH